MWVKPSSWSVSIYRLAARGQAGTRCGLKSSALRPTIRNVGGDRLGLQRWAGEGANLTRRPELSC